MAISLSDKEMQMLYGQSHFILCTYVMAIRPRMDFKTGVVGICPGISYQALAEWLYVEPRAGLVNSGSPNKSAIRRAIDQLKKIGLIVSIGNDDALVFKLPFANTGKTVQNKPDTNPTHHPDTPEATPHKANEQQADTPKMAKADTQQVSGLVIKQPQSNSKCSSTENAPAVVVVSDLIFTNNLTAKQQADIIRVFTLEETPPDAQQGLLDEYAGAKQGKEINNPVGFIRVLAKALKAGRFVSEKGDQVANARAKRVIDQLARAEREQKSVLQEKSAEQRATLAAKALAGFKSAKAKAREATHA